MLTNGRFKLQHLLLLTALVAVQLTSRHLVFSSKSLEVACYFPPLQAVALAIYFQLTSSESRLLSRAKLGFLAGGILTAISATILGIEVLETFRRSYPEYWQWSRDWLSLAWIIATELATGGFLGALLFTPPLAHWCTDKR
ncbi:hypothetical protein Psta_0889 [Pirellula staleyi DSM 6068]|uniref:Uncharacterized protein n=1 Tax=Pirellula staleyi (strain ATCC 27377 / DSM 6068 / ICPB 4128) TaxID=530564 RepID=D2R778_PIRSD|nr:hypothetical protein [Pirellula staleyi]ADB15574.1 hypothetical protein Psta_0889 [Pirellula staleyi DSM 6068]